MKNRYGLSKAIQKRLEDLNLTAEEVIIKALGMNNSGWTSSEGIHFPEGTVFMEFYKNRPVYALVKNGALTIDDKVFGSLSAAAAHYTGRPTTSGWAFWGVRYPGEKGSVPAHEVRAKHLSKDEKTKSKSAA